jgi:hypothetical protein
VKTSDGDDHVLVLREPSGSIKIPYDWELAGRDGASFVLKPGPGVTPEEIAAAKACLYRNRDVVTLRVERSKS